MVSTPRERLGKFIRELHGLTTHVKILLGEMKSSDLGLSTVIPGYGRTLKQFTVENYKVLLNDLTNMQDDKTAFIKGLKVKKEDIT